MHNPLRQALRIGVASDGVAIVIARRGRRGRVDVLGERCVARAANGFDLIAQQLSELLDSHPVAGRSATVVLADALVRMWQVTPPAGSTCMADLQAAAGLRFQSLFGAPVGGWTVAADWNAAEPFLAAAVPLALLEQLEETARAHRIRLVEVVPQFVAALNHSRRVRKPGAWFGLMHGGVLTLAAWQDARLVGVRPAAVPANADASWLHRHVTREALRFGIARPDQLQLLGAAPAAWCVACGPLSCSLLDAGLDQNLSPAAHIACTGSAA